LFASNCIIYPNKKAGIRRLFFQKNKIDQKCRFHHKIEQGKNISKRETAASGSQPHTIPYR